MQQANLPVLPADFANRVVNTLQLSRSPAPWPVRHVKAILLSALVLVGCIAVGCLVWPAGDEQSMEPLLRQGHSQPAQRYRFNETLSEAGQSLAHLSRDTAGQALEPTKIFFASSTLSNLLDTPTVTGAVRPNEALQEPLQAVPLAARESLAPVTNGPRRAISLFLRDSGLARANLD
jgi:hypothetical protein